MTFISGDFFPLFVGVALVLLTMITYRVSAAAQPLRLKLAQKSEELLANPGLPDGMKEHVRFLANTAFNMRLKLIAAIFLIPVTAVIFVLHNRFIKESLDGLRVNDPSLQKEFDEACRLHRSVTLANHALLMPFVEFEMIVFMTAAILVRAIINGVVSDNDGRDILSVIEDRASLLNLQRVVANTR